jgi:hypothetical protein
MKSYTVEISINGELFHRLLNVQAETEEEAEDTASNEITLRAKEETNEQK